MNRSIVRRIVAVGLLAGVAACQSGIPSTGTDAGWSESAAAFSPAVGVSSRAHLYVATVSTSRKLAIERYRLHHGIPASSPDRVYNGYSGLIAVAGNGTLYSTLAQSPLEVDVFSPSGNKPVRKIEIVPDCHFSSSGFNVINAVAADANGYLFVLIYSYAGAARVRDAARAERRPPCNGIAVYPPNAGGKARPVQTIQRSDAAGLNGLAVDANDNLYVSGGSVVEEYANAVVHPKRTRTFSGKYLGDVRSVATNAAGDLFIGNAEQSYSTGWINRYLPSQKGSASPASRIDLAGSGPHLLYSMAIRGRYLYLDDSQQFANPQSVGLYYALKNGAQSPFYSLAEPKIDSIAVGP